MDEQDRREITNLVKAARSVRSFIRGADRDVLRHDLLRRKALAGQFIHMAGTVKRISPEFKAQRDDVPWAGLCRIGDDLLRNPERVGPEALWRYARTMIPELILKLGALAERDEG